MQLEQSGDQSTRYAALVDRAVEFVDARGGVAPEDMLVRHVFGAESSPRLWANLLHTILKDDPRIACEPGGNWTTNRASQSTSDLGDYVVVDVETTGLKSRRHRIIEVAILSVAPSGEVHGWSTLVDPERRIPEQISRVTGLRNADVVDAPLFRSVAPTILELIGSNIIVGHNVDFDVSFLNAELQRAGYPKLINQTIDTLAISDVVVPSLRRLSLDAVAKHFGVSHNNAHRALSDAETTLAVFWELQRQLGDGGTNIEELHRLGARSRRRSPSTEPVARGRAILDSELLDGIPHAPGVYIMRDRNQRVIYVGKANDLRKRVSSYFSHPLGYTRKMDGLLESIAQIEVEIVGSELAALVLESQLIRRYRPRFNRQQRNAEQYVYVRVDLANPWPTVTLSRDRSDDGARYFGPYRSERQTRDAVRLINDVLPLRSCRRTFRDARSLGSPCIDYSLKRCAGPCIGMADPDEYLGFVKTVLRFFEGDTQSLMDILHARLERAAEMLDFERAAKLRDQIKRLDNISLEQSRINDLERLTHAILVLPGVNAGTRDAWYLIKGQRWAQFTIGPDCDFDDLARRLEAVRERATRSERLVFHHHHTIDEASILGRWLRTYDCGASLIRWPVEQTSVDVARLVLGARAFQVQQDFSEEDSSWGIESIIMEEESHGKDARAAG